MAQAARSVQALASLFYPHVCAGCGSRLISNRQSICLRCRSKLPETGFFIRPDNPVEKSFWGRIPVEAAGGMYYFTTGTTMQNILHALKYEGNRECGVELGSWMGHAMLESGRFSGIDVVVPMPLFEAKRRLRGYNQSALLAQGAASALSIRSDDGIVRRTRDTPTQTRKNRTERWENVSEVFKVAKPREVKDRSVLLVDDVVTTGASLEACGRSLLEAGCARLLVATAAFTER